MALAFALLRRRSHKSDAAGKFCRAPYRRGIQIRAPTTEFGVTRPPIYRHLQRHSR